MNISAAAGEVRITGFQNVGLYACGGDLLGDAAGNIMLNHGSNPPRAEVGKYAYESGYPLYSYIGMVDIPPLGMVDDIISVSSVENVSHPIKPWLRIGCEPTGTGSQWQPSWLQKPRCAPFARVILVRTASCSITRRIVRSAAVRPCSRHGLSVAAACDCIHRLIASFWEGRRGAKQIHNRVLSLLVIVSI